MLWKVSRAYKVILILRLEIEMLVPLLNYYLDGLTANYLNYTRGLAVSKEIQETYNIITSRL